MRIATFAMIVSLTLLATTALAQTVTYDYDSAANFASYKTYAWTRGTELTDELTHARVVRAIDAALAAKGLARVEPSANPDVRVAYHANFEQDLEISGSTQGWGPLGLGGDRWGSARVQPLLVGTAGGRDLRRADQRDRVSDLCQQRHQADGQTGEPRQENREGGKEDVSALPAEAGSEPMTRVGQLRRPRRRR